ncbi:protein shisa-like-1 [Bombina bombina]|uniref:protein shisa-like-1 n=1 Tax=Bombina bombina TaxID=8345 RepID=UPI00235A95BF|nr:protein shisa-like-1 [Bombina bombina]
MDAKDNGACGFFVQFFPPHCSCKQCPEYRTPEKMKPMSSANLLLLAVLLFTYLWKAFSINVRTCDGYPGPGDLYHSGFHCPRLSDSSENMYCCCPGNDSLKFCCSQEEFEMLMKVNLSEVLTTYIHRSPLPLLGIGFYGLLILSLMIVDFLYYYRLNKNTFYHMLSHTWIGKHLVASLLHRNVGDGIQLNNRDVNEAAKGNMSEHEKCDKQKPLEGNV